MALEVISRPEKRMDDGFDSRWNGSRTPLNYKFKSDLFPVNEFDSVGTITVIQYVASKLGTQISCNQSSLSIGLSIGDYVEVNNTGTYLDGSFYKISEIVASNSFIIKAKFDGIINGVGTVQKYYKGYKALVNVYVGAPSYHPYYDDDSKPEYLASQIQVDFGGDNEGVANVRQLVKPDLNSKFDEENTNSHYAWTSFFIEYAETWDNKTGSVVFEPDVLENCLPFNNFDNNNFSEGGDDWDTQSSVIFGSTTSEWSFNIPNQTAVTSLSYPYASDLLYQDIYISSTNKYRITIDVSFSEGESSYSAIIAGSDFSPNKILGSVSFFGGGVYTIDVNPYENSNRLGVWFSKRNRGFDGQNLILNSISVSSIGSGNPCDYSSFALFGSKQFQDPIGGNFGDYVLRPFGTNEAPKMLTNFESIELFPNGKDVFFNTPFYKDFSNYVCGIIPASTFSQSEDGDNVFLEFNQSDGFGFNLNQRVKVESKSDGVYVVGFKDENLNLLSSDIAKKESYCQFIIIPSNMLSDGDNGTYENQDPATWDIIDGDSTVIIDSEVIFGKKTGELAFPLSVGTKDTVYNICKFNSPLNTVLGLEYIVESDVYFNQNNLPSSILDNTEVFINVEGYDLSELSIQKQLVPSGPFEDVAYKLITRFTAKNTSTKILFAQTLINDIVPAGIVRYYLKDTTFQGPIDYISEKKPINVNTDCFGYKGVELRWLNTLGGWEFWKFKQYQDVKEKFKKTEIKSDIFTDYDDYFINGQSQYKAISVDSRKSVTVRSGLLTEDQLKNVGALQRSIEIQYKTDLGKWQTCSIKSGSFTSLEEKNNIREISFDIELVDTLTQEL